MTAAQWTDGAAEPLRARSSASQRAVGTGFLSVAGPGVDRLQSGMMALAAALIVAAAFLPLWGMTLVSVQYPEGLRMVVYPTHIRGDITEINVLNHYIGMAEISDDYFRELKVIPLLFGLIAVAAVGGALVRRAWARVAALALMMATAGYGFWSMRTRLYQFGHDLDPTAAIDIEPFTPAMIGTHTIAQFATYAYFSWGTFLPVVAAALVCGALWLDLGKRHVPVRSN